MPLVHIGGIMIIDITDVLMNIGRSKQYLVSYEEPVFSSRMGEYDVVTSESFKIEVANVAKNKLHITGNGSVTLAIPCSRCLSNVDTIVDFEIDNEISLEDDEAEEQCFITSHSLDVDKMLYMEILLNVPGKVLCKEDCKGICTVCGNNLNISECGCDTFVPDPRMSAINDIFEKFNKNS